MLRSARSPTDHHQESYFTYAGEEESPVDHDILFRPGIGADGTDTFTPRTLIYDLKGGFGNLRKINALYELEEERNGMPQGLWFVFFSPTFYGHPILRDNIGMDQL